MSEEDSRVEHNALINKAVKLGKETFRCNDSRTKMLAHSTVQ